MCWPGCVNFRDIVLFFATLELASLSSGFVVALSRQLLMLLSKCICRDKVVKCHDIDEAPMSSDLLWHYRDTVAWHSFLLIVVTNYLCLLKDSSKYLSR